MIKQPAEMTFVDKRFTMILYGAPGIGKSTLALSAPDPILIDFDRGISRVKARHRKPTIFCENYEEVLSDLKSPEVGDCQTIIVDTGGSFVSYLQDWAIRDNPALNRQKNGALSLKGFGAVKQEFNRFSNHVRDVMNKNLIYVFHSDEQKDKDGNPQQRLLCEGASRNIVWQPCDFGGYVQMVGANRVVNFTPTQEYFAKGCYGIGGQYSIPDLTANVPNDFLASLFDKAKENIEAENDEFKPLKVRYDAAMNAIREIVNGIDSIESANDAAQKIPTLDHALTSLKEGGVLLSLKVKALGFKWDKANGTYIAGAQT